MKRRMMTAACVTAAALVFAGCGSGAGADAQGDQQAGQESQETEEQDGSKADDMADNGQESQDMEEREGGAADDAAPESAKTVLEKENADDRISAGEEAAQPAGKSVSILGDSISTFSGYNPEGYAVFFPEYGSLKAVEDTWWHQVVNDLDLTLYQNGSSAGATVVGDSTDTEDPLCAINELRTDALMGPAGACPDIILVYLGTNDLLNTIPMGTNDGTVLVEEGEVTSFSDAYSLMLDKLQAKYPPAEIYCCTLLPVGDYGTDTPYVDFVNGDELTAVDYSKTITQIAENRGLYVIDLQNCGVTIDNLSEMTTDGVHPTQAGMVRIAEAVKKALAGQ